MTLAEVLPVLRVKAHVPNHNLVINNIILPLEAIVLSEDLHQRLTFAQINFANVVIAFGELVELDSKTL